MTPEQREAILESLRAGCVLPYAQRAAGVTGKAFAAYCAADRDFERECDLAREEGRVAVATSPPVPVATAADPFAGVRAATARANAERAVAFPDVIAASAAQDEENEPAPEPPPKRSRVGRTPAKDLDDGGPDWESIRAEAAEFGEGWLGWLRWQDYRLEQAQCRLRMSPWWQWTMTEFYASRLMWLIAIVGRGGGKSTTLERLAIVLTLLMPRSTPPGEAWQWPFVSVRSSDARRRLFEIQAMIRAAYGLPAAITQPQQTMTIALTDASGNAVEFVSLANTIGNMSGQSSVGGTLDEAGKMSDGGANPHAELIVSLAETSRARDGWHGVRCSSATTCACTHQAAIDEGTNLANFVASIGAPFIDAALQGFEDVASWEAAQGNARGAAQIRAFARTLRANSPNVPTWVANQTISPIRSRLLIETVPPDLLDGLDRTTYWLRESGSMPLATEGGISLESQVETLRASTAHIARRVRPTRAPGPMKIAGVPVDDPRYGGPAARPAADRNWRKRPAF